MIYRILLIGTLTIWLCCSNQAVLRAQPIPANVYTDPIATAWADMTVKIMTKAAKNTPTFGSRALGYLGLTMYETVVYASPSHQSIMKLLADTVTLPKPDKQKKYCWELALNAGQAYMLKALYGYMDRMQPVDSLTRAIRQQYVTQLSPDIVDRSEQFGTAIAAKIYQWSLSDGGHDAYLRNFPKDYVRPQGTGVWVPPIVGQSNTKIPMHPSWGQNRTFIPTNAHLPIPKPLAYAADTTSQYFKQYREVYERSKSLTEPERAIVMWWGDDPTETCSPPGHSYNLATIAIRASHADLVKAAETYARVGMAVADAFICCWKAKFMYMVERPSSFIQTKIAPSKNAAPWLPFFLEPPFPSFYSGHAVQSAATATVLTELYGKSFSFTDNTHSNRPDFTYYARTIITDGSGYASISTRTLAYKPRRYSSFWEAAQECADSRLMGGIHTRQDNEVGLVEGRKIGGNVNALRWKRKAAS